VLILGSVLTLPAVQGQEQTVPELQSTMPAGDCSADKCDYYYDELQNVYVIAVACKSRDCYCPVQVVAGMEGGEPNANALNQQQDRSVACAQQSNLAENQMRFSLKNGTECYNVLLDFVDPSKLPGKSVRFHFKLDPTAVDFKWEIKVTFDPGVFDSHKAYPLTSTATRIGESNFFYSGGGFENFQYYDESAGKTRVFECKKNYRVEITRGK